MPPVLGRRVRWDRSFGGGIFAFTAFRCLGVDGGPGRHLPLLQHRLPTQLKQLQRADKVVALVLAHEVGALARGSTTSCVCSLGHRLNPDVLHGLFQSSHHRNCSLAMRTSTSGEYASNSASSSCSSALGLRSDSQTPSMCARGESRRCFRVRPLKQMK